ncbi:MAG: hypothetical protein O2783_02230 [Chloroflexi bacterium]|nr:hypothetical protein [Chloroflexota bacterium]
MTLGQEYLILVFLVCCSVVQVAAAYGGLKGLLFIGNRRFSAALGIGVILGSLAWFFWDGDRNLPDTGGGIAGASQFGFFVLGGFLALLVTFAVTSFTNFNRKSLDNTVDTTDGLTSLRETTFFQALSNNLGMAWKLYRRLTRKYSSG